MTRSLLAMMVMILVGGAAPAHAQNPIVAENQLPGNPPAEWEIDGAWLLR